MNRQVRTAFAVDAGFMASALDAVAGVDAFAGLAAVDVAYVAEFALLITVLMLTLVNCKAMLFFSINCYLFA